MCSLHNQNKKGEKTDISNTFLVAEESVPFTVEKTEIHLIDEEQGRYPGETEENTAIGQASADKNFSKSKEQSGTVDNYIILGQLFNMYILVQKGEALEIYDQHIIHERILYEELKEKFYSKKLASQNLLIPQKIELDQVDKNIVLDNIEIFRDFGFDIDDFGENEIILRAVPSFDFRDNLINVFSKLLSDIKNDVEIKDIRERIIISMSCKGAIKAGEKLELGEMKDFVYRLHLTGKYTCPHGRPIIINISRDELDKMFGRKG